jgi:hypothetical protein
MRTANFDAPAIIAHTPEIWTPMAFVPAFPKAEFIPSRFPFPEGCHATVISVS